jgi:uncharacterized metal-binding protein
MGGRADRGLKLNSAYDVLQVLSHVPVTPDLSFRSSSTRWHFLYFLPLPHQQSSFLPMILG